MKGFSFPFDGFIASPMNIEVDLKEEDAELIPVFKLPYGFHSLSLCLIAEYYDGGLTSLYESFVFPALKGSFREMSSIDFGDVLQAFFSHLVGCESPKKIQESIKHLFDRNSDFRGILDLLSITQNQYSLHFVPRHSEIGIVHILRHSSDFSRPHIFLLDSIPSATFPSYAVSITAGQPILMNSVIKDNFATINSIEAKSDWIPECIASMKIGQFQIDWAIVVIEGHFALILCRTPTYFMIGDGYLQEFDKLGDAFANTYVICVSYRHSAFISSKRLKLREVQEEFFHFPVIPFDKIFCCLIKERLQKLKNCKINFRKYIRNCVKYPSFYLTQIGIAMDLAISASIFIDLDSNPGAASSIASEFVYGKATLDTVKQCINQYNRFCFWLRSVVRVLKALFIEKCGILEKSLLAVFKSLPAKSHFLVAFSVFLCTEAIRRFHKFRTENEDLWRSILRIFRYIFGDRFDEVMNIRRFDVPRTLRSEVVHLDSCIGLFCAIPFKNEKRCANAVLNRFEKYLGKSQIEELEEAKIYQLLPAYLEFLNLQSFEKTME
jgi:hypothetical protein